MSDEEREIRLDAPEGGEGAEIAVGSGDEEEVAHVEIPETLPVLPLKNTAGLHWLERQVRAGRIR